LSNRIVIDNLCAYDRASYVYSLTNLRFLAVVNIYT